MASRCKDNLSGIIPYPTVSDTLLSDSNCEPEQYFYKYIIMNTWPEINLDLILVTKSYFLSSSVLSILIYSALWRVFTYIYVH